MTIKLEVMSAVDVSLTNHSILYGWLFSAQGARLWLWISASHWVDLLEILRNVESICFLLRYSLTAQTRGQRADPSTVRKWRGARSGRTLLGCNVATVWEHDSFSCFMGSFIEEIYYAQSDFICKQRRGCAGSNFRFTLMHRDVY